MELTKNVFFNTDKLIPDTTVKISYTGEFFQNNSEKVFIHYGFGLNWNNIDEIEMTKTELGFQCEIALLDFETFNFCFKNSNGQWDNNGGGNFVFPIEKIENSLVVQEVEEQLPTARKLRKTYLWSKKIKLALYKIIISVPKLISGNYKRKIIE